MTTTESRSPHDTTMPPSSDAGGSLSPSSQLTPESSGSSSGGENTAKKAIGRGQKLKLRTDIVGTDDNQAMTAWPDDGQEDRLDFVAAEEVYEDDGGAGLYSKSYTAEEEARVVRKFDRKLTTFMALLYMLSFLDRSSESKYSLYMCRM